MCLGSSVNDRTHSAAGSLNPRHVSVSVVPWIGLCISAVQVKYQQALAAVFVEHILFVILALLGVRQAVIKLVPRSIMLATSSGIGLFLAFTGLQAQQGLGVVTYSTTNVVALGIRLNEEQWISDS